MAVVWAYRCVVTALLPSAFQPLASLHPLFVTERYLLSSRPLTSHFLSALCADCPLCTRAIAQSSFRGLHLVNTKILLRVIVLS